MSNYLTRREFFSALAASVVTAGCPLPVGFPTDPKPLPPGKYSMVILDIETMRNGKSVATVLMNGRTFQWNMQI